MKSAKDVLANMGLEELPEETKQYSTSHKILNKHAAVVLSDGLSLKDAARLAQVDKFFFHNTQERVNQRAAEILVEHIALGRLNEAEKIVKANPKLLLLKAKVKDYAGHLIVGADGTGATAYECALGAGFLKAAEMLAGYFTDEEERLRQHKRQLAHGWVYEGETLFTIDAADALIEEILKSSDEDIEAALKHKRNQAPLENQTDLREALDAFREKLAPRPEVKAGKHINHQNLLNGLVRYAASWQDNRWTHDKYRLYCYQALGFIGRDESASVAKYLAKGLCNITADTMTPTNFDFSEDGGSYFPLDEDDVGLGFDSCANFYRGGTCHIMAGWAEDFHLELKNFLEQLHFRLEHLANPKNYTTLHQKLTQDVALLISNQLELIDAVNLAKSEKFFWKKTGPRVKQRVREYAQTVIDHLVLGRFQSGVDMIQETPKSLFWKAKAKNYAGRDIVGADGKGVHPYEVALLNGHVKLAQWLASLFTDSNLGMPAGGAERERLRQHKRQLPQGFFVRKEETYTVDYFQTKMQAAVDGDPKALAQFREDFKPREIRAGTAKRHQALINALLAFEAQCSDWTWQQSKSVWKTLICTLLRNAPARREWGFARELSVARTCRRVFSLKMCPRLSSVSRRRVTDLILIVMTVRRIRARWARRRWSWPANLSNVCRKHTKTWKP